MIDRDHRRCLVMSRPTDKQSINSINATTPLSSYEDDDDDEGADEGAAAGGNRPLDLATSVWPALVPGALYAFSLFGFNPLLSQYLNQVSISSLSSYIAIAMER